jgi:hypothetical protein
LAGGAAGPVVDVFGLPGALGTGGCGFGLPGTLGFGEVVVDVPVEMDDGGLWLVEVVLVLGLVLVLGVGLLVVVVELLDDELVELGVVAGGQDSVALLTGPGRFREDSGAPGASWKYSVWPLTRTTVTVQSAADADGSAATPDVANTTPAVTAATFSFGRLSTSALSPPAIRDTAIVHAETACAASY